MGKLDGWKSIPVNVLKLLSILHYEQARNTGYHLDGKARDIAASPAVWYDAQTGVDEPGVDCSGFHRYLMFHGAIGAPYVLPDGSSAQNDYYNQMGFKHHAIDVPGDYTANLDHGVLYACFCRAGSRGETIGHVWFIFYDSVAGQWSTIESHGGHGPNSRPALTSILSHIVTDVYAICEV